MNEDKSVVQRQFGRLAPAYARSASSTDDLDLSLLRQRLALTVQDRILDVATGTGFTALALRPQVRTMIGIDLTREMLQQAVRLAASTAGIVWIQGDAGALPFLEQAFTVVTCTRSAHHFPQLDRVLGEMRRVLRPGGRLGIIDPASPDGTAGRDLLDTLERLRDPSHVRTLTPHEWSEILQRHRFVVDVAEVIENRIRSLEEWLDRAGVGSERRRMIKSTLAQAPAVAQAQIEYQGGVSPTFIRRWIILVGHVLGGRE